jgi:hypothetical protein
MIVMRCDAMARHKQPRREGATQYHPAPSATTRRAQESVAATCLRRPE